MIIRNATLEDLAELSDIEKRCFPPEEAAKEEDIKQRLEVYPDHFWILENDEGKIVSFIDGMTTDQHDLTDIMFEDPHLHDPDGKWQMIFGLNTLPDFREKGYAGMLIRSLLDDSESQGRAGAVLTCKEHLVDYYAGFGFENEGVSASEHGGAVWYQMRKVF